MDIHLLPKIRLPPSFKNSNYFRFGLSLKIMHFLF